MIYKYKPQGVCSVEMNIDVEEDIVKDLQVVGGCSGNLQGISKLLIGMKVDDVIERLKGIKCGIKGTSCPDQIAKALELIKKGEL